MPIVSKGKKIDAFKQKYANVTTLHHHTALKVYLKLINFIQ